MRARLVPELHQAVPGRESPRLTREAASQGDDVLQRQLDVLPPEERHRENEVVGTGARADRVLEDGGRRLPVALDVAGHMVTARPLPANAGVELPVRAGTE